MPDVDFGLILNHLLQLAIAYVVAVPLAWERESEHGKQNAGLRTIPLVAIACCGFVLISRATFPGDAGAQARVLYGLMTGIGFIGGGAVLKHGGEVRGTATAASIWVTGAIGAAVGFHRYEIAIVLSIVAFATLRWSHPLIEEVSRLREATKDAAEAEAAKAKSDEDD